MGAGWFHDVVSPIRGKSQGALVTLRPCEHRDARSDSPGCERPPAPAPPCRLGTKSETRASYPAKASHFGNAALDSFALRGG
jgi:hypothetical protein